VAKFIVGPAAAAGPGESTRNCWVDIDRETSR
jgi:hypothetical protein